VEIIEKFRKQNYSGLVFGNSESVSFPQKQYAVIASDFFKVSSVKTVKFILNNFPISQREMWQTSGTVSAQISVPGHFGLFAASHQEATVKYLLCYVNKLFVLCDRLAT